MGWGLGQVGTGNWPGEGLGCRKGTPCMPQSRIDCCSGVAIGLWHETADVLLLTPIPGKLRPALLSRQAAGPLADTCTLLRHAGARFLPEG